MQAVLAGSPYVGLGGAIVALVIWGLGALAATMLMVTRKRRVNVRQLLKAAQPA